jgi:hypothetical protein
MTVKHAVRGCQRNGEKLEQSCICACHAFEHDEDHVAGISHAIEQRKD